MSNINRYFRNQEGDDSSSGSLFPSLSATYNTDLEEDDFMSSGAVNPNEVLSQQQDTSFGCSYPSYPSTSYPTTSPIDGQDPVYSSIPSIDQSRSSSSLYQENLYGQCSGDSMMSGNTAVIPFPQTPLKITSTAACSSRPTSTKGLKHRHPRVYGLSEDEQKERTKELNKEAAKLFRQRKKKQREEAEVQELEERQRKMMEIYQQR